MDEAERDGIRLERNGRVILFLEVESSHSTCTALLLVLDLGKKGASSTDGKLQVFYVGTIV